MTLHDEIAEMMALHTLLEEIDERQESLAQRAVRLPHLSGSAQESLRTELIRDYEEMDAKLSDAAERLQALPKGTAEILFLTCSEDERISESRDTQAFSSEGEVQ